MGDQTARTRAGTELEELTTLVERAQCGDLQAFGRIIEGFQGKARRYAGSVLGDSDLVDDAAQESFIQVYRGLPQLRDPAAFPGWFKKLVLNQSRRLIRGKRVRAVPLEEAAGLWADTPGPAEVAESREMKEKVLQAIGALPEIERKVASLYYFQGCSQAEIAELLGLPLTTVNNRLHSSRRLLRENTELRAYSPIERMSRSKGSRNWLPSNLAPKEIATMAVNYKPTKQRLARGNAEVLIRAATRDDLPAVRQFDRELEEKLEVYNAQTPPGRENWPGGPWSDDEWLAAHFEKYERAGNITLLAEDPAGNVVGFADLWVAREPAPFGDSLDVECIDYFRDYYYLGLETVLLEEAEKVARAARLPAIDIGTNTSSGDYPSLRAFGLKVFYEYDNVRCRCPRVSALSRPQYRQVPRKDLDLSRLLRVAHWCPTDFTFSDEVENQQFAEFTAGGQRVIVELPPYVRGGAELFASPEALQSSAAMSTILRDCVALAGETGAEEAGLPCPSNIEIEPSKVDVISREFAFAWMRKAPA